MSYLEQELRDDMDAVEDMLEHVRGRWHESPIACVIVDVKGNVADLNASACEWLGRQRDFALRTPLAALFHASYRDVIEHLRRCRRSRTRTTTDLHIVGPRRGRMVLRLISLPMANGFLQTVIADVSDRRSTDYLLRYLTEASLRLNAFLDAELTARAASELAVPFLADICGFDRRESGGWRPVARTRHERNPAPLPLGAACEWLPRVADAAAHARESGMIVVVEDLSDALDDPRLRPADRSAVAALELRAAMIVPVMARDSSNGVLTLYQATSGRAFDAEMTPVIRELARRIDAAFTNITLHDEVVALSRSKDEFLAHVSHELREPLTALRTWIQVARLRQNDPVALDEALRTIEEAVNRNARLVGDLVDVVRSPSSWSLADAGPVDLELVAANVVRSLGPMAQRAGIELVVDGLPDHGLTWGDGERLRQIVTNLATNAIRHARATVTVSIARQGETVELRVCDDGGGIAPELEPELFQPFPHHRDRGEDTLGVGLAVVRRLVELHGGDVSADAGGGTTGRGATFIVSMPRLDVSATQTGVRVA